MIDAQGRQRTTGTLAEETSPAREPAWRSDRKYLDATERLLKSATIAAGFCYDNEGPR